MYFDQSNNYFEYDNSNTITFDRNNNIYSLDEGFNKGNMFKDIYSKYKNHVYKLKVNNEKDKLLYNIQMYTFALKDLVLYLDIFDDRYKYITERFKDVPDLLAQVAEVREDFYGTIFEKICKKYGLELDDMTNDNNIFIMTKVLYEFLILYYIDNVKAYVKQYIIRNKRSLVERFGGEKKLDLAAMKKSVKNSTNAIIITSMYKIIEAICDDRDTSIKDVLRLIISEDESEFNNYFMEKYFIQEEVLTSDKFNQVFFSILNPSGDSYMRIVNEIQLDYIQSLR